MSTIVKTDLGAPQFSYRIDEQAWAAAERLDGKLLLVTSLTDMDAEAVVERYRSLADTERGFRVLKSSSRRLKSHRSTTGCRSASGHTQ